MATLKPYGGVLSHLIRLIADSGISPEDLQLLHSSGRFSALLNMSDSAENRSANKLYKLCSEKLEKAAGARRLGNMGDWFDCMRRASELLRALWKVRWTQADKEHRDPVASKWETLNERYKAEVSALLLLQAYGRQVLIPRASFLLAEAMKERVPCHVCHWRGTHGSYLTCQVCKGTKLLEVSTVICPQCSGSGEGTAYEENDRPGVCSLCIAARTIVIDSCGKEAATGVESMLGILGIGAPC